MPTLHGRRVTDAEWHDAQARLAAWEEARVREARLDDAGPVACRSVTWPPAREADALPLGLHVYVTLAHPVRLASGVWTSVRSGTVEGVEGDVACVRTDEGEVVRVPVDALREV